MHNWPGMEAGTPGVCAGPMMAAANGFKITVRGKGGHASAPQDCADPVPALFAIGQAFQTILTRCKRPLDAAVLSITQAGRRQRDQRDSRQRLAGRFGARLQR